jgi:hypothetical protein
LEIFTAGESCANAASERERFARAHHGAGGGLGGNGRQRGRVAAADVLGEGGFDRAPDFSGGKFHVCRMGASGGGKKKNSRTTSLIMRRLGDVGLDALEFLRLQRGGLLLHFLLQPLDKPALLDDDAVELLDLMFEVRDVRFEPLQSL